MVFEDGYVVRRDEKSMAGESWKPDSRGCGFEALDEELDLEGEVVLLDEGQAKVVQLASLHCWEQ